MDDGRKRRAASALIQCARSTFKKDTEENNLVAPISPSPAEVVRTVIDDLGLEAHDVVLDLGCGDGRWLVAAALKGCHGRGFDLNNALLEKGRRATAEAGELTAFLDEYSDRHSAIPNDTTLVLMCLPLSIFKVSSLVKLTPLDMFDAPLEGSTVIIVYLFREGVVRMKSKLEKEADPGARVVSVGMRGWVCLSTVAVGGLNVYVYRVPDQDTDKVKVYTLMKETARHAKE